MSKQNDNGRSLTDKDQRRENNQGQRSGTQRRDISSPGGGGSDERVPAKGNDITHEEDQLQTDIKDDIDNNGDAVQGRMREVQNKRDDEGQDVMQDKPRNPPR